MKTFDRPYLPETLKYNNKIYRSGNKTLESVQVNILSPRLRGVKDLHGRPYKPTVHYFNPIKTLQPKEIIL